MTSENNSKKLNFRIEIDNPPRHLDITAKRKVDPKTLQLKKTRYYLTGNLFYSDKLHFTTRIRIVNEIKKHLLPFFQPVLEQLNGKQMTNVKLSLVCMRHDDNFDLDNWESFWKKIILDMLKTPTDKMIEKAKRFKSELIHLSVIPDDRTKHVNHFETRFVQRGNMMIVFIDADPVVTSNQLSLTIDKNLPF